MNKACFGTKNKEHIRMQSHKQKNLSLFDVVNEVELYNQNDDALVTKLGKNGN